MNSHGNPTGSHSNASRGKLRAVQFRHGLPFLRADRHVHAPSDLNHRFCKPLMIEMKDRLSEFSSMARQGEDPQGSSLDFSRDGNLSCSPSEDESSHIGICASATSIFASTCGRPGHNSKLLPLRQPSGVRHVCVLSELSVGESGILQRVDLPETVQDHLMYMGFVPDALVEVLRRAPAGDPTVYAIDGMQIALRHETAAAIHVRRCTTQDGEMASAPDKADE